MQEYKHHENLNQNFLYLIHISENHIEKDILTFPLLRVLIVSYFIYHNLYSLPSALKHTYYVYYHGFLKISRLNNFGVKYVYVQGIVIPILKVPENLENL